MPESTKSKPRSVRRRAVIALIVIAAVGSLGAGAAVSGGFPGVWSDNDLGRPIPKFSKNDSGQTYGSLSKTETDVDAPDLISAVGTNGLSGYIRREDLLLPLPQSPEQALIEQAKRPSSRTMPLYKADGKSVIGEYRSGGAVFPIEKSAP